MQMAVVKLLDMENKKTYKLWYTEEYKNSIEALWRPVKVTSSMDDRKSNNLQTIWDEALKHYNEEKKFWQRLFNRN